MRQRGRQREIALVGRKRGVGSGRKDPKQKGKAYTKEDEKGKEKVKLERRNQRRGRGTAVAPDYGGDFPELLPTTSLTYADILVQKQKRKKRMEREQEDST